jgi:RNA-binding protein 25
LIDRKLEPLVKKLMVKYLGELDDDDVVMYVIEHLKDHKSPAKLVEGLEPVRVIFVIRVCAGLT